MSPSLIWVLRRHEYWRLAWTVSPRETHDTKVYRRGGKNGTAMKCLKAHQYDTRRWLRNSETMF